MIFDEVQPQPRNRSHLQCCWRFVLEPLDPPAIDHAIVPDGTATIVVERAPTGEVVPLLMGPAMVAHSASVRQGVLYAGARLLPGAVAPLLGLAAGAIRDTIEPLALRRGDVADRIAKAVLAAPAEETAAALEGALAPLCATAPAVDPAVALAAGRIIETGGKITVARLALEAGLSERQLRRRFGAAVALSPKQFARIQRLRHALTLAMAGRPARWSAVSADTGFADQAHLARETARSFGTTPRLLEAYLRMIRHRLMPSPPTMSENFKTEALDAA